MNNKKIISYFFALYFVISAFIPLISLAGSATATTPTAAKSTVPAACTDFADKEVEWTQQEDIMYFLEVPLFGKLYVTNWNDYLETVYNFSITLIPIFSLAAMFYGGFRWAASAGNEQAITSAKNVITSAIIGLLIALLGYGMAGRINSALVDNHDVRIYKIPIANPYDSSCELPPESRVDLAISAVAPHQFASSTISSGGCPNLKVAIEKALVNLSALAVTKGAPIVLSGSGWRSAERQWYFFACYCNAQITGECKSGACNGCQYCESNNCNLASKPCDGDSSRHPRGLAVDVKIVGTILEGHGTTGYNCLRGSHPTDKSFGFSLSGKDKAIWDALKPEEQKSLCEWQKDLKEAMTGGPGTPYDTNPTGLKGIKSEWWHFQLSSTTACFELGTYGLSCPCKDSAPTNCPTGQHAVCKLKDNSYSQSEGWQCMDSSIGSEKKTITKMISGNGVATLYNFSCIVN
ncbi:MAG: hypothetical protein V1898_03655 [Patescibacteria group bacterium]